MNQTKSAQHVAVARRPSTITWRFSADSSLAPRAEDVALHDSWLPSTSCSLAPPRIAPSSPSVASASTAAAAASRASNTQAVSAPVMTAQKLRNRLPAVSVSGASLLRTYHRT